MFTLKLIVIRFALSYLSVLISLRKLTLITSTILINERGSYVSGELYFFDKTLGLVLGVKDLEDLSINEER